MFSSNLVFLSAVLMAVAWAAAPPPNQPPCPTDFVAKYKNATAFCEEGGDVEALNSATKTIRVIRAAANVSAIVTSSNVTSSNVASSNVTTGTTTASTKDLSSSEEEEADPEIMLCTFGRLKQEIPQLEILERSCQNVIHSVTGSPAGVPKTGGTTFASVITTSKSIDNLDEDLQMASCLEEKLETMCPELSSVV